MIDKNFVAKLTTLPEKKKRKRVINPKECQFDMKDELPLLFRAFHNAVLKFNEEVGLTSPEDRIRGFEATYFNAKLVQCLRELFGNDLKYGKYGRVILFKNGYVCLFKKLNSRGLPMNIRTKNSVSIGNQLQGNLFNCEDDGSSPIVIFGYSKDKLGALIRPRIVYIDEERLKWTIEENQIVKTTGTSFDLFPPQPSDRMSIKPSALPPKKKVE